MCFYCCTVITASSPLAIGVRLRHRRDFGAENLTSHPNKYEPLRGECCLFRSIIITNYEVRVFRGPRSPRIAPQEITPPHPIQMLDSIIATQSHKHFRLRSIESIPFFCPIPIRSSVFMRSRNNDISIRFDPTEKFQSATPAHDEWTKRNSEQIYCTAMFVVDSPLITGCCRAASARVTSSAKLKMFWFLYYDVGLFVGLHFISIFCCCWFLSTFVARLFPFVRWLKKHTHTHARPTKN